MSSIAALVIVALALQGCAQAVAHDDSESEEHRESEEFVSEREYSEDREEEGGGPNTFEPYMGTGFE